MSRNTKRGEDGKFTGEVDDQDILKVFDYADDPVLTAKEIAEELPITKDSVTYRLKNMEEEGLVGSKKTGARSVAWWAEYAPELSEETKERVESVDSKGATSLEDLDDELEA